MVYIGLQCIKTIIIYFVACQYQRDNLVTFSTSTRLTRVAQFLCNSCVSFLFLSGAYVTMLNFYFMHSFGLYCLQWRHHAAGSEFPMVIHHESYSNTVTHGVHADVNPGNVLRRLPATGGGGGGENLGFEDKIGYNSVFRQRMDNNIPRHISSSRAHSDKIPTAIPIFLGSGFLMVVLPISWDIDICQKSKMAAKLPEVRNFAGFTDTYVVPKTIHGFMTIYETFKCPAVMADATSCRKSKMAAN